MVYSKVFVLLSRSTTNLSVTSDFPIRGRLRRGFSNPHTRLRRFDKSTATRYSNIMHKKMIHYFYCLLNNAS